MFNRFNEDCFKKINLFNLKIINSKQTYCLNIQSLDSLSHLFHFVFNFFIAKISNTSRMCMSEFHWTLLRDGFVKSSILYLLANLLISLSERNSFENTSIHLFNSKQILVFWIFQNFFIYFNVFQHENTHVQNFMQSSQSWE